MILQNHFVTFFFRKDSYELYVVIVIDLVVNVVGLLEMDCTKCSLGDKTLTLFRSPF